MEIDRSRATPRGMPSLVTALTASGLTLALLLVASPAWAGRFDSGEAVRSGADGYTRWGNTPAGGPVGGIAPDDLQIEPSDGLGIPCHADGMGGCVVPVCGDPLSAGECRMPTVTITVTAYRSTAAVPPGVTPLNAERNASAAGDRWPGPIV